MSFIPATTFTDDSLAPNSSEPVQNEAYWPSDSGVAPLSSLADDTIFQTLLELLSFLAQPQLHDNAVPSTSMTGVCTETHPIFVILTSLHSSTMDVRPAVLLPGNHAESLRHRKNAFHCSPPINMSRNSMSTTFCVAFAKRKYAYTPYKNLDCIIGRSIRNVVLPVENAPVV
jgi:hypothetical protein